MITAYLLIALGLLLWTVCTMVWVVVHHEPVDDVLAPLSATALHLEHALIFEGAIDDPFVVATHRGECPFCSSGPPPEARRRRPDPRGASRTNYGTVLRYASDHHLAVAHVARGGTVELSDGSSFKPEDGANLTAQSMGIFRQAPAEPLREGHDEWVETTINVDQPVRITGPERPCGVMHHGDCGVRVEVIDGVRIQTWACAEFPYEGPDLW